MQWSLNDIQLLQCITGLKTKPEMPTSGRVNIKIKTVSTADTPTIPITNICNNMRQSDWFEVRIGLVYEQTEISVTGEIIV